MIGPRFVVWRLFNPKWHIMNLFDDGNFGETKSFVKGKGVLFTRRPNWHACEQKGNLPRSECFAVLSVFALPATL